MPDRLEYQFACVGAARRPAEKVLAAEEYYHGHLDWYNFDVDPDARGARRRRRRRGRCRKRAPYAGAACPTPVTFNGMPNTRWWAFEDGRTNFGDVEAGHDRSRQAAADRVRPGLRQRLVPRAVHGAGRHRSPTCAGMAVTNVFGERIWIEPAGGGADDDWQRWSMFTVSVEGERRAGRRHQPAAAADARRRCRRASRSRRSCCVRDEMANMVWGVERTIPLAERTRASAARGGDGDAAPSTSACSTSALASTARRRRAGPAAPIRYEVMNAVPEHWIPFIPVHVAGDNREMQLQRARDAADPRRRSGSAGSRAAAHRAAARGPR